MAFSNILFLSTTLLLAFFNLSSGNPALDQANATVSAVNKTNALEGAHHVLRLGGNGSALNHDIQSSYIYCSSNSYCWSNTGYGSSCYNGKCICDIGYHSSLGKCVQTSCTFDTDCSVYQYNTRCNINDRCVCKYGTYLDSTSQTCKYNYYPSSGGGAGETVGFSFGGFIFLIIVISLCVLCCRNRRQRIPEFLLRWGSK
ncbi:hypothetical protein TYRP_009499 [Tyrophagus putrescentiae]|nr:hypothetical protein TYRP_009499 [Tyrophagus putrescentiae]